MKVVADRVRVVLALLGPLGAGSRVLLLRLVGRFGWKTVAAGALVAVYAAARYRTWIVWALLAWSIAAWMHAPQNTDEEPGGKEEETAPEGAEEPPADPFPGIVRDLIGDAPGVHLKTLLNHLHDTGLDPACTMADVTAALTRRRIPIRASVRDAEQRVNRGVHRADLEAWSEARSPVPAVALSKTRSNIATTALSSDVAESATDVATPPTLAE
jgi:hypothetical protein